MEVFQPKTPHNSPRHQHLREDSSEGGGNGLVRYFEKTIFSVLQKKDYSKKNRNFAF